jgi:hypothetical protein
MSADATAQQRRLGTGFRTRGSEKPDTFPFGLIRLARRYETGLLIPRVPLSHLAFMATQLKKLCFE